MTLHHTIRAGSAPVDATTFAGRAEGLTRRALVGRALGAQHASVAQMRLEADGAVALHAHGCEETAYVTEGTVSLILDGATLRLGVGDGAVIPVGAVHAWRADGGAASWIEAGSPPLRLEAPPDTWFLDDPLAAPGATAPAHFHDPGDAPAMRPTDALLVFGGTTLRMLVDARLGAALHTLFTVRFEPGASLEAHDHPFEEAYLVLEGTIDALCEGELVTLGPGDALWTGVGCIHSFANPYDVPVRWLETQAPQPPARHGFRFLT
jgi:quercetin dioxygenase-like cupin family protein